MSNLKSLIQELNTMVLQGKLMEAFEKFYHDDVVMQENELPPTIGKSANRKRESEFVSKVIDFRKAEALDVTVGDNVTMVKWAYDYTHQEWGHKNYTQVSVQHWLDGRIVREQFFYGG